MPKPEGWTEAQLKERDRIAEGIIKHKKAKKKNAYAIATYRVEHAKKE